jgi:hypothetical protein
MDVSEQFLKDLAYQLVQERGAGDSARKEAQEGGEQALITWSFLNLPTNEKAKATLDLLFANDMEKNLSRLSTSIDKFNHDSGRLYVAYIWLTVAIMVATVINAGVAIWQTTHPAH